MKNDTRQTYARTYLTGICRDVGMPLSVDLMIELSRARGKPTYDTVWCRFDQVLASREEQPDDPIESAQQIGDAYAGRDDQLEPSEQPDHRPALPDPRGRPDVPLRPVYPKYSARTPASPASFLGGFRCSLRCAAEDRKNLALRGGFERRGWMQIAAPGVLQQGRHACFKIALNCASKKAQAPRLAHTMFAAQTCVLKLGGAESKISRHRNVVCSGAKRHK